ncbi:response regulator [Nocardioides sp. PD653]|uniref:response regulator n=1 Tax=Nocardioides sp. PD653 TaxID=393303 RepID=UPI0009F088C0|nr:response regulator transcription factor [Nocardioides sp. PD653]GAW49174.1 NarL family two-component response regulator [Nocardioides sp. PD653-B2]GAW55662.1 NarL family two-component response regulator [Nocardioides sp. PD653]
MVTSPPGARPGGQVVTVVIADDHPVYREGLAHALAAKPDIQVLGQAGDGLEALDLVRDLEPDIALVDLRLPSLDGIAIAEAVTSQASPTLVVIVSAYEDTDTMYRAFDAGAKAYLTKLASPQTVYDAAMAVLGGEIIFPESVRPGLTDSARALRRRAVSSGTLTAREREVLTLIAQGRSAPEIAEHLFLGVTTVRTHLQHIYDKLGVSERASAVAVAARRGLLE